MHQQEYHLVQNVKQEPIQKSEVRYAHHVMMVHMQKKDQEVVHHVHQHVKKEFASKQLVYVMVVKEVMDMI